jgi:hypothetical protein
VDGVRAPGLNFSSSSVSSAPAFSTSATGIGAGLTVFGGLLTAGRGQVLVADGPYEPHAVRRP